MRDPLPHHNSVRARNQETKERGGEELWPLHALTSVFPQHNSISAHRPEANSVRWMESDVLLMQVIGSLV